ncbi:uncharacterized protein K452DRAFT_295432 [Aplosporella prunicola CBS 121167]|uniref:Uncharacterized protein n=1 Tax=Aplosporella prunicola CBS 121167 TaxID=1176127 RepID=A0A6A6BL53_9PEZI|nr:uncharacterized protein K452DRAFT_295432 [Aplosporella prunicola CBS 121167]KAF2144850.1 hypothetical protein K452DRAFT_295432 [Aplosporella prunicola CBS 121167]
MAGCVFGTSTTQYWSSETPYWRTETQDWNVDSQTLVPQATYWIRFYVDVGYRGDRLFLENRQTGVCYNLPNNWNDRASSIQVSDGRSCQYWRDAGCTGSSFGGNDQDWTSLPRGFNDQITSWRCS